MQAELFVPDLSLEHDRLAVVEQALGQGGLVDNHLRWKDLSKTPSAALSDADYGYMPPRFTEEQPQDQTEQRPSREPVDFTQVSTDVLGEPYDLAYPKLVQRVNEVDNGWFDFLVECGLLDPVQCKAMKAAALQAYRLNTLTEDNLPAYTSTILGGFMAMASRFGLRTPALEEWSRGIWTAEEDGHKTAMNEYGKITAIINDPLHVAGRTSQLRSGMEIELAHVIQLFGYVDWQEQSARLAHDRNADLFGPVGHALQDRIGSDESRHHYLYHEVIAALHRLYPEDVIRTLRTLLIKPVMPGSKGIPHFVREALSIHKSGVFGVEHAHKAGRMVLQKLGLLDKEHTPDGLSDEGHAALEELRQQYQEDMPALRRRRTAFVLGETVTNEALRQARIAYAKSIGLASRAKKSLA